MNRDNTPQIGKTWMIWDGECGLCRRVMHWVKRQDRNNRIYAIPFQDVPTPPMTPALYAACENAVHVITPHGRILRAGKASLYILETIGYGGIARLLRLPPFIYAVEAGYKIVATNRNTFSNILFTRE